MLGMQETSSKKKILVVEDNELNLKLFHDLLVAHGYDVVFTRDGEAAYAMACEERPDLVIMDIQLHGISGIQVIKQIKEDPALSGIPVVAVSAFAMREEQSRIMRSGCDAYVSKPISIVPFLKTIQNFFQPLKAADTA
jgi:two-component system cell cycle response regulator DivK